MARSSKPQVSVKLNPDTMRYTLRSKNMRKELEYFAGVIADAANANTTPDKSGRPGFFVDSAVGKKRARAAVVTGSWAGWKAETRDRALTRAIDAGRRAQG